MKSYTNSGTSVSRQHPKSFTIFLWFIWERIATSLMNWLISPSSMFLDLFIATTHWSVKIPLYTMPCPPWPRIRVGSKLFVAFSSSSKKKIFVLSLAFSSDDIICSRRSPWFFLKYVLRSCFWMSRFHLRHRNAALKLRSRKLKPPLSPMRIPVTILFHN